MNDGNIKGKLMRQVAKLEIKDIDVTNIIVNSLIDKGFELISETLYDIQHFPVGEQITVYRVEQSR